MATLQPLKWRKCLFLTVLLVGSLTVWNIEKTEELRVSNHHPSSHIFPSTHSALLCGASVDDYRTKKAPPEKGHMTYLSPKSPPPCKSVFPYKYMLAPRLDPMENYIGNEQISEIVDLVNFVLLKQPNWKLKRSSEITEILTKDKKKRIAMTVRNKTDKLLTYIQNSDVCTMGEVQRFLSIVKGRKFPKQRRPLTCDSCFVYGFKNIISPNGLCQQGNVIDTVIIITTIPNNVKERQAIRKKWGSVELRKKYNCEVIFLFGVGWSDNQIDLLKKENAQHNDILMDDFTDNYYNLTQKVLMGFRWVLRECPKAQFVIRAADDTSINIEAMFGLIHTYGKDEAFQKYQVGECYKNSPAWRVPDFKGYLNTLEYDRDIFPPYALGTVFLTSINLTRELVDISPNIPFLPIEDSYFGLALEQLGRGCHDVARWRGHYTTHKG